MAERTPLDLATVMVSGKNDWVIEDSEEEDQLSTSKPDGHRSISPVLPEGATSSINAFTSMPIENISHISSVGTDLPARPTISSFPPPPHDDISTISESSSKRGPRPRPRPISGRTGADPASISDPILPRTPTYHRSTVAHSDPIVAENTIDPELNNFTPDIAERAKVRTRKVTKRSTQCAEEVIDITDDDFATTPAPKLREKPKPRIRRAIPVRNNPQQPSDPGTIPMLSSSPLLPPSDLFPTSTAIKSTPPQSYPPNETAAPNSPSQGSPIQRRKRKHTGHPHPPTDVLPDPNCLPVVQVSGTSPRPDPLPPSGGVFDATYAVDPGRILDSDKKGDDDGTDVKRMPKKSKSSKKTVVEVVITSPRSKKVKASKKGRRNLESNSAESRNDHPASSPIPAEQILEDEDAHVSPQQMSDGEDELILAPRSSRAKSRKEKPKARDPSGALLQVEPSGERVAEEGEEPRKEHHTEHATTSRTNGEPGTPVPNQQDRNPSPTTPAPGKLRFSLSRVDRKTPMRELIRRAASHPSAPFSISSSPIASPLAKTAKSALRRIAPLHSTRRTPPPPPPRPPPPKKSKKMLELEEKWEMELEDEVEGWWALADEERLAWRRAKRNKELGYDD